LNALFHDFFSKVLLGDSDDEDDSANSKHNNKKVDMKMRALKNVELYMNTTLSKKYLDFFSNKKEYALCEDLIQRYKVAFCKRLKKNTWLHKDTIEKIIKKMDNMNIVIGYKNKWEPDPDPHDIMFSPIDAWENYVLFHQWSIKRDIKNTDKKVLAKDVWLRIEDQNVYDVNAYYNVVENELVLPNAILQPPFVDSRKNMSYNIAHIGTTIGHEIMHGYDDDGFNYDENGRYIETGWWTNEDTKKYKEKQQDILRQYEKAAKQDNVLLRKGNIDLGENIADIGGFLLSEDVLIQYLNEQNIYGKEQNKYLIEFYAHYAKQWRSTQNINSLNQYVNLDVHSFNKYRVNCVLAQSTIFRSIYNIQKGDKMYYDANPMW
jgi:putative endopeptidase